MVKAKGIGKLLVVDHTAALGNIENTLKGKKINIAGNAIVYSSMSIWQASIEGAVIVVESELEIQVLFEIITFLQCKNSLTKSIP